MVRSLLITIAACAGSPVATHAPKAPTLDADDQVFAAVFHHEIKAAQLSADEAVCLRVRSNPSSSHDASDALLDTLVRTYPIVVAGSGCSGGGFDPVTVSATHGKAVMFDIGPIVRMGDELRVQGGGGHRGGGSIHEVEYRVVKAGGSYRVASERLLREN
ncbi:MAG: hypothetical protein ABI867_27205 [Kofleriaceae bacterium]